MKDIQLNRKGDLFFGINDIDNMYVAIKITKKKNKNYGPLLLIVAVSVPLLLLLIKKQ